MNSTRTTACKDWMISNEAHSTVRIRPAITSGTFEQQWTLDPTGNWSSFKEDSNGVGTFDLVQSRSANKVNEITGISNTTGTAWATPGYDAAGNMTGLPDAGESTPVGSNPAWVPLVETQWNTLTEAQWSAMTENYSSVPKQMQAQYDAWNRLVSVRDGASPVVENTYDARGYRIAKATYTNGTLDETRHYYYTPGGQCVEERVDSNSTANRQYVWGLRYIDDLVLRDRDTDGNGTLDERRYGLQDGNWNMIALTGTTSTVTERFAYSAYGSPVFLNASGAVQSSSASKFETLYAGYKYDLDHPQIYYVRNRFLLPQIGTWNRRDPLGYVDGMGLYVYGHSAPSLALDPLGSQAFLPLTDPYGRPWNPVTGEVVSTGRSEVMSAGRSEECPAKKAEAIRNRQLQYSCKCGWIDWTHAGGPDPSKPGNGLLEAQQLIAKIREIGRQSRGGRGTVCFGTSQQKAAGPFVARTGVNMCFYVFTGLSENEILCAAWGIFSMVMETFEKHQGNNPVSNSSGYSPEDLPSDVLMFHRANRGSECSPDYIRSLCQAETDIETNLRYCAAFDWDQKNLHWNFPVSCGAAANACGGSSEPQPLPTQLQAPRCDPDGQGENWGPTGRQYIGIYPETLGR